jgi:protein disulfide-isomerase-like protein
MKLFLTLLAVAGALELTPENWDKMTSGKSVFIKFFAPWCGHCKRMAPAWQELMDKYDGHATALVADVDCTAGGKDLCETHGVQGFPTLKHGDPAALEDYDGGRDLESMQKFAEESLKPLCSPANMDLCDADKKQQILDLQALSADDLDGKIKEGEKKITAAEENFKSELETLQKSYEKLQEDKDATIKDVKDSGLGLMKAVAAHSAKGDKEEL